MAHARLRLVSSSQQGSSGRDPIEPVRDATGVVVQRRCTACGASVPVPGPGLRHAKDCPYRRRKNPHGTGKPVYKPSEKRWWISLTLPDGTRKQFYGKTAAEATRKRDRARAQIERGLPLPDERLTTGAWLRYWFEHIHRKEIKPSTVRAQRGILEGHLLPVFDQVPLARLTGEAVEQYMERKLKEGLTPAVVGTHRGILRKAIQGAASRDRVARNVVEYTSSPKRKRQPPRVTFTAEETLAFLRVIRGHPLEGVFLFGMALGLRIGEATGVTWDDIDLETRVLYLRHQVAPDVQVEGGECLCRTRCGRAALLEDLKSESCARGLKLPAVLVPALRRQAQRVERMRQLRLAKGRDWLEHGLVFPTGSGRPMQPTRVRAWLRPLGRAAGLPPCRFHDLRHAWGSLMKAAGISDEDLAQSLGHASADVTRRVYLHALPDSALRVTSAVDHLLPPHPDDTEDDRALRATLLSLRVRQAAFRPVHEPEQQRDPSKMDSPDGA